MDAQSGSSRPGKDEPEGFLVEMVPGERIHFLDWGGPDPAGAASPILLIHGLSATAWSWSPVARRLNRAARVVALDLRGHGLSDAPTSGYTREQLAEDVIAVAEGSGLLAADGGRILLAGHGYGGIVAAWAAARLGLRCAGLVLVDGGWEDLAVETGMTPDEWLRDLDEPPGVMRSMAAFLADRRDFDPATWDADQEQAARSTVVEVPAGKVVAAVRPHALAGSVAAIFAYDPVATFLAVQAPMVAIVAGGEEAQSKRAALARVDDARRAAGLAAIGVVDLGNVGHNLMRYRPAEVTAAILAAARA
jgi:pimeloyl-ACP methyl ester carboxylesterase